MNAPCENCQRLQALCEEYLQLRQATWRPYTLRNHHYTLRRFVRFLHNHYPHIATLTELRHHPHIEEWIRSLQPLKPISRATAMRIVQQFFEQLIEWQWPEAPVPGLLLAADFPPVPEYLPKPLEPDEDRELREALKRDPSVLSLAVQLLRHTGLRIGELFTLTLDCVNQRSEGNCVLRVPPGKTYQERTLPLSPETESVINQILQRRGALQPPQPQHAHRFIVDEQGRPIAYHTLWRYMKKTARDAELCARSSIHPHRLRHSFASELARTDIPLLSLMRLLGHKHPEMTLRYVRLNAGDVRQAYQRAMAQLPTLSPRPLPVKTDASVAPGSLDTQLEALIAAFEHHRRDQPKGSPRAESLGRFVKRLRGALRAFKQMP
jgi:site-specific recombinase XerD